jgi:hypothetical protein
MVGRRFSISDIRIASVFACLTCATAAPAATIISVQSGVWNDPATWDVAVPTADDDVRIRQQVDVFNNAFADTIRVGDTSPGILRVFDGTLATTSGLFVGADGFFADLAVVRSAPNLTIGGGFTLGADATLRFLNDGNSVFPNPIDVVTGNVALDPGWAIALDAFQAEFLTLGDRIDFITYTQAATFVDPPVTASGVAFEIDDSTPGILTLVTTAVPERNWIAPGTGDWFNASNWDLAPAPTAQDDVIITNGGTAQITAGSAIADEIELGLFGGSGTLEITDAQLQTVTDLNIAAPDGREAASVAAADISAAFTATNADVVIGGDLDQGNSSGEILSGTATINTAFTMSGGTLTVGMDYDLGSPFVDFPEAPTVTQVNSSTLQNASLIDIGHDLDLADTNNSGPNPIDVTVDLLVENVTELRTGGNLDIADMDASGDGDQICTATATFRDSTVNQYGAARFSDVDATFFGIVDSAATVAFDNCTWLVADHINIARLGGGGGITDNACDARLTLTDTDVTAGGLRMGHRFDDTTGVLRGRLELVRSFLATDPTLSNLDAQLVAQGGTFELGEASELVFTVEGATRAAAAGRDAARGVTGLYSAIDVNASDDAQFENVVVQLAGTLEVQFDFPGVQLGDTFDLIRLTGDLPFTGEFDAITVTGLPDGADYEAGIATDSEDRPVYRLVITEGGVNPCPWDQTSLEGGGPNGVVDPGDFFALLQNFGPCPGDPEPCTWDRTSLEGGGPNGVVDPGDFFALLQNFGPCPE